MLCEKVTEALDRFQTACDRRMANANAANEPKIPLFHYTNEEALFSILDSGQFWFTSIYHMDDPEELSFGFNVARELFKDAVERSTGLSRAFCRELGEESELERIKELIAFYSVSFGLRDVAQQWADYADKGCGIAFGLAPEFFRPAAFDDPENPRPDEIIFYGKIAYGPVNGRARHTKVVDAALALIEQTQRRKRLSSGKEAMLFCRHLAASMYTEIIWNCVTTKDAKWCHQNEMRILARNFLKDPKLPIVNEEIRPRVEIGQPRLKQSIVEVMIGPKADEGAVERVRSGLASRGLEKILVSRSSDQQPAASLMGYNRSINKIR
ncbi:hypothetical protein ABIC08_009096 [Bradyrhizobium sp. RT9b]|uniref:hypothetical protein n=1 Tax=Bradyrhizobium sp. RT9b TaxID=3156385 RepID=UPI003392AF67